MIYGYARVSTAAQDETGQVRQLKAAGCEKVFREKITGTTADRPQLAKLMKVLAPGDVVITPAVDRLSRDTTDLLVIARDMQRAGAGIRSLAEPFLDTTSDFAEIIFAILGVAAKLERRRILERTARGRADAKANGVKFGRKPILTAHQQKEFRKRLEAGETQRSVARSCNVSQSTISRLIRGADGGPMMNRAKTKSEALFEQFLGMHNLPFEPIPVSKSRTPDYLVAVGEAEIIFEVKELSNDENLKRTEFNVSTRIVGDHIRSKISESKKQIQSGAKQGRSTVLLVYNNIDLRFGTEDRDFIAAMYGEHTVRIHRETRSIMATYRGRNKSMAKRKNTSFSALGRLLKHPVTHEITVTLFENIFAKIPLMYGNLPACFEINRFEVENGV